MNLSNESGLINARKNNYHYVIRNIGAVRPTWEDIFFNLEKSLQENSLVKHLEPYTIITHNAAHHVKCVNDILNQIQKLNPNATGTAHAYICLTALSQTFGNHCDDSEVFFWQAIGKTKWKITDRGKIFEYTLQENDLVYIPVGIYHDVITLTPRVGISFGLDN